MKSTIFRRFACILLAGAAALLGTGCQTVQPWQRGDLAKPSMTPAADPLANSSAEHVFFSREAAHGGRGLGGGGCGCN